MAEHEAIKLFEENKMRVFFDDLEEQWYFCINDVVQVLTDSKDPSDYFKKMRRRDHELDDFVRGTICPPHQFASSDGKSKRTSNPSRLCGKPTKQPRYPAGLFGCIRPK